MSNANTASTPDLFQPFQLGPIELANRIVMAPLTRSRAEAGNVPGALVVEYYEQRASMGLKDQRSSIRFSANGVSSAGSVDTTHRSSGGLSDDLSSGGLSANGVSVDRSADGSRSAPLHCALRTSGDRTAQRASDSR